MKEINVVYLYPNEMNTYGDRGNLLALVQRLKWHGYMPVIHYYHVGGELPPRVDIVIGGGGQDSAQTHIQQDIQRIKHQLTTLAEANVPMILVCGSYQLFGHRFITQAGEEVKGIGIFDIETIGGKKRMIGNIMIKNDYGTMFGFENHSGKTYLEVNQKPFGLVIRGNGNNGDDKTEGAQTNHVYGTYMHGPLLPNNPRFTDELIRVAVENVYGTFIAKKVDDHLLPLLLRNAEQRRY